MFDKFICQTHNILKKTPAYLLPFAFFRSFSRASLHSWQKVSTFSSLIFVATNELNCACSASVIISRSSMRCATKRISQPIARTEIVQISPKRMTCVDANRMMSCPCGFPRGHGHHSRGGQGRASAKRACAVFGQSWGWC